LTVVKKKPPEVPGPVVGKPYPGKGVITIINVKESWVEINHEDIEGLMPAMQMEWWVKDRALLRNAKVGDKVEFVVVETGHGEFTTELKRAK
jgi:Cu/Ag efflux protein CusF